MSNIFRYIGSFLVLTLVIAGCGGDNAPAPGGGDSSEPTATGTPAPAEAPAGGTGVAGKVVYDGTPPERSVLDTEGDPKCAAMHASEPLLSDREVVSADGGVQWAFVYVKNPPEGDYPAPEAAAELDQHGCRYSPHVLGVQTGQKLLINNSDALLHNVRAIARNQKPINYGQPANSAPRTKVWDTAEMAIRVKCDVHPWMTAYLFVMDHPYYAVTDENGAFSISGLPAGDYTLGLWHEAYGEQELNVTVSDGAMADASFTVKPAE
jgi:hypothetical protein